MTSFPLPHGKRKTRAKHREAWSDPSTERLGLIGHGAILSDTKGNTCPKRHQNKAKRLACVGSEQYRVRLVKPVMHESLKTQRRSCLLSLDHGKSLAKSPSVGSSFKSDRLKKESMEHIAYKRVQSSKKGVF